MPPPGFCQLRAATGGQLWLGYLTTVHKPAVSLQQAGGGVLWCSWLSVGLHRWSSPIRWLGCTWNHSLFIRSKETQKPGREMCSCSPAPRTLFLATSVPSGGWLHGQQCQCGLWGFIWASMHCTETKNCLPGRKRPLFLQPSRGSALAGAKLQQKMKSILTGIMSTDVPLWWCKREKKENMLV